MKPLAIDLFCGLGGWAEGFLSEGYDVIGFDIEARPYPGQLVLQDVLTLHGSQFRNAACIVASPPCQKYSYMAMPWTRAKQQAQQLLDSPDKIEQLNALFNACFRIQREATEAADCDIPMVVENVKGAQPWVGRAKWHYGSFYLWGDVPALMPFAAGRKSKVGSWDTTRANYTPDHSWDGTKTTGMNWSDRTKHGQDFTRIAGNQAIKNNGGSWFNQAHNTGSGHGQNPDGRKQEGSGAAWLDNGLSKLPSGSNRRKQASAKIAIIPPPLAQHIARVFKPPTRHPPQ